MLFVELRFFLFFAVVLLVYWTLQKNNQRKNFLLLASYFFYGSWDWRFAVMLFLISSADYLLARAISVAESPHRRKLYVVASISMNLGVLGFFKYCNFFIDSAIALAATFGVELSHPTLHIILPVGISFLTFQSLSYTIDVYRREIPPVRVLRDYLLFASFFPQLVAGPIVRPIYFVPQLKEKRTVASPALRAAALLFLIGFVKKTCIADNIAPYVDQVFHNPQAYDLAASWTAIMLYAAQIYCDFSGYSDMAIAVAGFMGYKLVLNFDAPYLATSIQDFWRRWHMSLSTWIRDYIYISLGGRSKKLLMTYRNLMITMLAGGLWHGAAWTFVAWGGLHGLGLVANHEWKRLLPGLQPARWRAVLGWLLTLYFVCAVWVFFRADTFHTAGILLQRYLFLGGDEGALGLPLWLLPLAPLLLLWQYLARQGAWADKITQWRLPYFVAFCAVVSALAIALLPLGNRPFIYFQF